MVSFQRVKKWLGKKSSLHTMHVLFLGKKFAKGIKKVAKAKVTLNFSNSLSFPICCHVLSQTIFLLLFGVSFSVHLCFWSLVQHWSVKLLSRVWLFAIPWTGAYQAPPSMEFSRQEYWSGFPFPSPGDLPDPGIEPRSPALQADALLSELLGKPKVL